MAESVGLHWGGKGWVGAAIDNGSWSVDHYPTISSAWMSHNTAHCILVTVPIGLPAPADGRRRCDEAAKELLGPRHSSVAYAPVRDAVYEISIIEAKAVNEAADFGIQNQTWSSIPRIREVDEFLGIHDNARKTFHETHPEVCFHALAGGDISHPPSTPAGLDERQRILENAAPDCIDPALAALESLTTPRYAPLVTEPIDVLDAFVAAITARRYPDVPTLPMAPPTDERGLPMEIIYPGDAKQLTLGDLGDR